MAVKKSMAALDKKNAKMKKKQENLERKRAANAPKRERKIQLKL